MESFKYIGLATLLVVSLSGCGIADTMTEMKDLMEGMKNTMEDMNDSMEGMKDKTDEMKLKMAILERESRQGMSAEARINAFDHIRDPNLPLEEKLMQGAIFYRAFEFQFWQNILEDDEKIRGILFHEAVYEFFLHFKGMIDGKMKDPNPTSEDGKKQSLMALSVTIDQLNPLQTDASFGPPFKAKTMLDLIKDGLESERLADNDPDTVPAYIRRVLQFKDESIYLLQWRHNALPALLVGELYDTREMSIFEKLQLLLKKNLRVDLGRINSASLREYNDYYLVEIRRVQNLLRRLGVQPKMNGTLLKILKKATFEQDLTASSERQSLCQEFEAQYSHMVTKSQ